MEETAVNIITIFDLLCVEESKSAACRYILDTGWQFQNILLI
jgi:hypothetical protein